MKFDDYKNKSACRAISHAELAEKAINGEIYSPEDATQLEYAVYCLAGAIKHLALAVEEITNALNKKS